MIPKSFQCMAFNVSVLICKLSKRKHGDWDATTQTIRINEADSLEMQAQTFWHEATHAILDNLSYHELSQDEDFVDRMGQCLRQLEKSKK